MKIHPQIHDALRARVHARGMVAIECDCGVHLAWPKRRGNTVVCPGCGLAETLPIADVPTAVVEPDGMNVKFEDLPPLPAEIPPPHDVE